MIFLIWIIVFTCTIFLLNVFLLDYCPDLIHSQNQQVSFSAPHWRTLDRDHDTSRTERTIKEPPLQEVVSVVFSTTDPSQQTPTSIVHRYRHASKDNAIVSELVDNAIVKQKLSHGVLQNVMATTLWPTKTLSPYNFPSHVTGFYSRRRYDRSGAAIQDYLMAHAFSYQFQRQYLGVCGDANRPTMQHNEEQVIMTMLDVLGLREEIPILDECPNETETSSILLERSMYFDWKDTDIWTDEWLNELNRRRKSPMSQRDTTMVQSEKRNQTMVIHIRRGDVHPCDDFILPRYMPNSHYLALLKKYRRAYHKRVIIHSEYRSRVEDWSDFAPIDNVQLKLDVDPIETWRDILEADVFIMSKSSFSLVPALFTNAKIVVYTPFWHRPRPHWVIVPKKLLDETKRSVALLRETKCSTTFDSSKPMQIVRTKKITATSFVGAIMV